MVKSVLVPIMASIYQVRPLKGPLKTVATVSLTIKICKDATFM
jgi:hypothetical protein